MQDEQNGQMTIFDFIYPKKPEKYLITKKVRLIELFAGIGSQAAALKRLGVEFEHYKVVEFDKFAIASYNAVHGTCFETSNITQIHAGDLEIKDTDKYEYIMTYSFPCQDLSPAGKQKGMAKGSGTRSGLLWEVERLLDECEELPQVLLMENVPQVIGKKNIDDFKQWQTKLESLGYSNFVELLNAKNYGIPQNRNRCFMVSILGNYKYEFPKPFELKIRLKDILEDGVDEKYYLSEKNLRHYMRDFGSKGKLQEQENICDTLQAAMGSGGGNIPIINEPKIEQVGSVDLGNNESNNRVYSPEGLSPTLNTMQGGHRQPKIMVREATKKGYAEAGIGDSINLEQPNSKTRRGRVGKGVAQTLTTSCNQAVVEQFRIRKLTPLECWRLMGFDDESFYRAEKSKFKYAVIQASRKQYRGKCSLLHI